jgi:ribosomal protein S18 acetylase RimI-like enzyme
LAVSKLDILIRKAAESDAKLLAQMNKALIHDEGSRNPMTIQQLEERMRGWIMSDWEVEVLQKGTTIIGYAVYRLTIDEYFPQESFVYLRQFYIMSEHRGKGYGSNVIDHLINHSFPRDAKVTIDVLASNPRGYDFWLKFGFMPHYTHMMLTK